MKGNNVRKINLWIGAIALSIIVIPFFIFTNNAYGTESGATPEPSVVAGASAEPTTAPTPDPTPLQTDPSVDPSAEPSAEPTADPTANQSVDPTPEPTTSSEPTPSAEPSQDVADGGGSSGGMSGGEEIPSQPDSTPKPWYVDPSRASSTPTGGLGNYAIISGGKTINVIVLNPSDTNTGGGSSWVDWFNSENGRNVYGEGAVLVEVGSGDWTQPGHDTVLGEEPAAP